MEVYLVRHGETGGNVAHRHQADDTPLSRAGRQQAERAAEEIAALQPTHLVSSSLVRAIETATAIGDRCDLIPETNPAFVELARPSHMFGHYHRSIKSLWFYVQWYLGSDAAVTDGGESYETLRERFSVAQAHLREYPADARVVVVTHSVFMTLFEAHLCRDRALTPWQAGSHFLRIVRMPNTHIRPLRFDHDAPPDVCPCQAGEVT